MRSYRHLRAPLHYPQQLLLPLFCWISEQEQELPEDWFDPDMDRAHKASTDETMAALYARPEAMHEALLYRSIQLLGLPGEPELKAEILDWINEPDLYYDLGKVYHNRDCAWSFAMCCRVVGVDPDALRELLDELIESVRLRVARKRKAKSEEGTDGEARNAQAELPLQYVREILMEIRAATTEGTADRQAPQPGTGRVTETTEEL